MRGSRHTRPERWAVHKRQLVKVLSRLVGPAEKHGVVLAIEGPRIRAEANYLLLETVIDEPTRLQQAGKYFDVFERSGGSLLIKERRCVYDSVVINNCLVFPV